MGNVLRVFWRDVKRILKVPQAWSVVLFLIVLPSLYTWFNVAGFWNPYDNTRNLRVCVVNEDAGVHDEVLGDLDLGTQIVEQLSEDDQLGWAFMTREQAVAEIESGTAYAAFVVPESFSADMATLTTVDFKRPVLEYIVNEKTGPVAPKITDTGANVLDTTINDKFISTVSETVAQAFDERIVDAAARIENAKSGVTAELDGVDAELSDVSATLGELVVGAQDGIAKVQSARSSLYAAQADLDSLESSMSDVSSLVGKANSSAVSFSAKTAAALDEATAGVGEAGTSVAKGLARTLSALAAARGALDEAVKGNEDYTRNYEELVALVKAVVEQIPDGSLDEESIARLSEALAALGVDVDLSPAAKAADEAGRAVDQAADDARSSTDLQFIAGELATETSGSGSHPTVVYHAAEAAGKAPSKVSEAADSARDAASEALDGGSGSFAATSSASASVPTVGAIKAELDDAESRLAALIDRLDNSEKDVRQAVSSVTDEAKALRTSVEADAMPVLQAVLSDVTAAATTLSAAVESQKVVVAEAQAALDQIEETLELSIESLGQTAGAVTSIRSEFSQVRTDIAALGGAAELRELIGGGEIDPEQVAEFMMSPTVVRTEKLYALNAYGSAMAPLFINLTLWIGVFMLMVIIRNEVDDEGIEQLTVTQRYFGRGLLLAILAVCQAVVCCAGCIAMGVQCASMPLFVLTAAMTSLVYLSVQYTLSSTFQHIGKALCIVLVFVQIPGATGLYPIEMTPQFFQIIYPLFPFTYGISAIRETIGGFYGNAWTFNMLVLAGFMLAFVMIAVVIRPFMTNLNRMFARQVEQSDILIGEASLLPARRYRYTQVLRALSDRPEYREQLVERQDRFMSMYPVLKQALVAVGLGVPIVVTAVLVLVHVEKVVVLTFWLAWFLVLVLLAVALDYVRDSLAHQLSLEDMPDDEVRTLYDKRGSYTRVKVLEGDDEEPVHHKTKPRTRVRTWPAGFVPRSEHNDGKGGRDA